MSRMAEGDGEFIIKPPTADGEPEEARLVVDEASPNMATDLYADEKRGRALLKRLGERFAKDFDTAFESTEKYRKRCAADWALFAGELPAKSFPWEGCANMHSPVLLEHASRIASRVMAELFGDWQNFHSYTPVQEGVAAQTIGETLTTHSNWQFRTQIQDFHRQMERAILAILIFGDATCHSYYDEETQTNKHEVCTPDDFVIPYTHVSTAIDYSDVPYRCKVLHYYRHQIQARRDVWNDVDALLKHKATHDDEPEARVRDGIERASGQAKPDSDEYAPRKLILYEGWTDALKDVLATPSAKDDRFVQAIVDHATKHVLSLRIHEEDDWRDKQRFDLQVAEGQAYQQATQQRAVMEQQLDQQVMMGMAPPEAMQQIPPAPPPPEWMVASPDGQPHPVRKVPIHMFVHAVDIENMLGSLGIGHGRILADLNRASNTALNQFVDAASLGNGGGYFTTLKLDKPIKWGPGAVNQVDGVSPEELKNAILPMQLPPANSQLLDMVKFADEAAEKSMQAGAVIAGEPGKSGETWRGLSARLEQATKQLSVFARKVSLFVKKIVENNGKLNAMFLPEQEIVIVTEGVGMAVPVTVGREMYARQHIVEVKADLRFATQAQRVGEADEVVQMVSSLPPLQQNPAIVHEAIRQSFTARGLHTLVKLLGPPPPPTPFMPPQPQPAPGQEGQTGQGGPPEGEPPQGSE